MGQKSSSPSLPAADSICPHDHVEPHQPIYDIGHSKLYYTESNTDDRRIQLGMYYFHPDYKTLRSDKPEPRAFLYVRPVAGAKQIFYVKRPARGVVDYGGDFWDRQDASDDGTASVSHGGEEHSVTPQSRPSHHRGKSGSFTRGSISGPSHRGGASMGAGLPVAKVAGVKCILCETTTFEKPWFAEKCKHVACSDCWLTWIETETTCPECGEPVDVETLHDAVLCPVCSAPPTNPKTSPCDHVCCEACWDDWLRENKTCLVCGMAPLEFKDLK